METKKIKAFLLVLLFIIQYTSCELFESTTVSTKEIKKASSWSKKDQAPSYPECESLKKDEQFDCFQNIVSEQIMMSISETNMIADTPLDGEAIITLKVDKTGVFSLIDSEISKIILESLPNLESAINEAVLNLPQALPATKTNVGVYVDTQFSLPIQIIARPIE